MPVWNYSLNNSQGQESQPIVYQGVMYVTTHTLDRRDRRAHRQADLEDRSSSSPPDVFKMACCGLLNRGVAIYQGKVYRTTLDAHVIALDAKTGKQLWKTQGHRLQARPRDDRRAAGRQRRR